MLLSVHWTPRGGWHTNTKALIERHCRLEALARGSREPGQALTGAAISGVLLCEGHSRAVVFLRLGEVSSQQSVDIMATPTPENDASGHDYVVVARRYRPQNFSELAIEIDN